MKNPILLSIVASFIFLVACNQTTIEDASYEDRPHFKIETASATYYYDKAAVDCRASLTGMAWTGCTTTAIQKRSPPPFAF